MLFAITDDLLAFYHLSIVEKLIGKAASHSITNFAGLLTSCQGLGNKTGQNDPELIDDRVSQGKSFASQNDELGPLATTSPTWRLSFQTSAESSHRSFNARRRMRTFSTNTVETKSTKSAM
ncbi:hypothetical protein DOTSEDRAFT_34439 [Dothistroma septosporum NZE10]|uniref:Uncharacterized protein n=1 Tax=Dothistroma septosporum (strain NZE10 / CBS 128990) TaxID=675120 RepID=N1PLG5_DOTSN|nr:hypothetical protein DOTSEDRAFT_34439 [Dothistroma septosporum NZE10]